MVRNGAVPSSVRTRSITRPWLRPRRAPATESLQIRS